MAELQFVLAFLAQYPAVLALIILVVALVLANLVVLIVTRVIGRLARRTRFNWDEQWVVAIRKPLFWTVVLLGVQMALLPLALPQTIGSMIRSATVTLLVIIWSIFLLYFIRIVLRAMSRNAREQSLVRPQTRPLFENLAFITLIALAVYFIFRAWQIDMTAWLASAGIVGIAVGFAAKDTLANLFSGVFILADTPYKIGDYVVLDSGERGKVTHIGIRSTRLLTCADVEITILNSIMGNTRIINESGGPHEKYRVRLSVGVAYGSDIDQVKGV